MQKNQVFILIFLLISTTAFFCLNIEYTKAYNSSVRAGNLVASEEGPVYYVGFDKRLHPFLHSAIFHSWFSNSSKIYKVDKKVLNDYQVGSPVCARPGSWLLKIKGTNEIYAVEPGCHLRPLHSEIEAFVFYGKNWKKRVIVLEEPLIAFYDIEDFSVQDLIRGIKDADGDGLDENKEKLFKTSDLSVDSDGDEVSDYEEINYWFSNPALWDTDKDGYADGLEILSHYSPLSKKKISANGADRYRYPAGSVVRGRKGEYFYKSTNGNIYEMDKNTFQGASTYNSYDTYFLIRPPFDMSLRDRKEGLITYRQKKLYYPTVYKNGNLELL